MVLLGSLPVHRGTQSGIIWLEEIGSECSVCDRFIDGSLLYWFPATEPHEHLCMPFPMTQLRATEPLQGALRNQALCLAVPAVWILTMAPTGRTITALRQDRPPFALIGSDSFHCEGEKFPVPYFVLNFLSFTEVLTTVAVEGKPLKEMYRCGKL